MPFEGLREFISLLEEKKELSRVTKEINSDSYEASAILDRLQKIRGKAVVFENIKNFNIPMCANVLGSFQRIALALGTSEQKLLPEWNRRKRSSWSTPKLVSEGPYKRHVVTEENVNLFKFPILKWNFLDGAPYITMGALISKDPETGQRNVGIYRLMIQGKNQLGINLIEGRHATVHYRKAESRGQPLEVAVAIGLDPAIVLAAATNLRLGEDELAFAGALRGEPVKVAACKTVEVDVPCSSEIVIEGVIPPKIRALEGRFGESNGYYGKIRYMPILKVKAITHREKPIFQATYSGKAPQEEHFLDAFNSSPMDTAAKSFTLKKAIPSFSSTCRRLKLELTTEPIVLPAKDRKIVADNWAKYGFE